MIPHFKAALFDMDGTLLHSMRYWRVAALEYLMEQNVIPSDEQLSRLFHMSGRKLCAEVLASRGIDIPEDEIVTGMEAHMEHHYREDTDVKDGIEAVLEYLHSRGIPMAVATASPRALAKIALGRHGLLDYFEFIADGYEYGITKREPEYFSLMAERLGVDLHEMCVFEDSLYAVESAKTAGCCVIAVPDIIQSERRNVIREKADCFIENYRELLTLLDSSIE